MKRSESKASAQVSCASGVTLRLYLRQIGFCSLSFNLLWGTAW